MKAGDLQLQQQYCLQKTQQNPATANRLVMNNSFNIQNPLVAKMYEENSTLPLQRDELANVLPKVLLILEDLNLILLSPSSLLVLKTTTILQKRFLEHVSQPPASMFGAAAMDAHPLRCISSHSQSCYVLFIYLFIVTGILATFKCFMFNVLYVGFLASAKNWGTIHIVLILKIKVNSFQGPE